jgi:hypothetical protein
MAFWRMLRHGVLAVALFVAVFGRGHGMESLGYGELRVRGAFQVPCCCFVFWPWERSNKDSLHRT